MVVQLRTGGSMDNSIAQMVREVRNKYWNLKRRYPNSRVEWTPLLGEVVRSHGFSGENFAPTVKALNKAYSESKPTGRGENFAKSWRRAS